MAKKINVPKDAIFITGFPLDGCENVTFLTSDNKFDIKTILAYDYEDGKHFHDKTCVLEIIFHNVQENIGTDRIRILYDYPSQLLAQLTQFMLVLPIDEKTDYPCIYPSFPAVIKMDLHSFDYGSDEENGIQTNDFEEFNCRIQHKKHFFGTNPELPDD